MRGASAVVGLRDGLKVQNEKSRFHAPLTLIYDGPARF